MSQQSFESQVLETVSLAKKGGVVKIVLLGGVFGMIGAMILGIVLTTTFFVSIDSSQASANPCSTPGTPPSEIPGNEEQDAIAKTIDKVAVTLGLPGQATYLALIAGLGESNLRNIDFGDGAINPDGSIATSIGVFQQQHPSWGTPEQIMNVEHATTSFFFGAQHDKKGGLVAVSQWWELEPTIAIHNVQRNSDPNHYARYYSQAQQIAARNDIDLAREGDPTGNSGESVDINAPDCGVDGEISPDGWTRPTTGPITSGYKMRIDPGTGIYELHNGLDIAPSCKTPIVAANEGVITIAGSSSGYGNLIAIQHDGVTTRYAHMFDDGVLVSVGDKVEAGQQIGEVGTNGNSTGCHLHFEVWVGGTTTDPRPFLEDMGVTW